MILEMCIPNGSKSELPFTLTIIYYSQQDRTATLYFKKQVTLNVKPSNKIYSCNNKGYKGIRCYRGPKHGTGSGVLSI